MTLNAWFIHAKNEKPLGTIIHFHGNAENISTHFYGSLFLAEKNFDVLIFDYRGYGLSTGKPSQQGLITDSIAIFQWLQKNARNQNFFIFAQSLGGAVAIPSYVLSPTKLNMKAIVLDSTFSSYRGIARNKLSLSFLTWPLQGPLGFLVSDDASAIHFIDKIHIPILFVHSKIDPVVPYQFGYELYKKAHQPKEFWEISTAGHTVAFAQKDSQYRKKLYQYFISFLGPKK